MKRYIKLYGQFSRSRTSNHFLIPVDRIIMAEYESDEFTNIFLDERGGLVFVAHITLNELQTKLNNV